MNAPNVPMPKGGGKLGKKNGGSLEAMHRIKAIGHEVRRLLERGDVDGFGALLDAHWQEKRKLASNVSNPQLDEHYQAARRAGALGGKLMGAGGGGFFMFYCRDHRGRLIDEMTRRGNEGMGFDQAKTTVSKIAGTDQ